MWNWFLGSWINCTKCHRDETCFVCINTNWYGNKCEKFCSSCPNNECKINGDCVDTSADCPNPHFYGIVCTTPCSTYDYILYLFKFLFSKKMT